MMLRGVRGATTVSQNTREDILDRTKELLRSIVDANSIHKDDVASIVFSCTRDLDAVFPAEAAREDGWTEVALECFSEMYVEGGLKQCIRILMHVNTEKSNAELNHIYIHGATSLRADLVNE
ncbi:MAG: chorismate mutase [Chloroflexi bacterium]|nr:chorismate mutase [Chloroflexota bacterium]|tara:strand:+ start:9840 stop:10205 length:366 start_codon:yes stop_codon:yes gene_type:complete